MELSADELPWVLAFVITLTVRVFRQQSGWRIDHGFSLMELIIVLGLLIVLVVLMFNASSRSFQRQQKSACEKNLQTVYVALEIFANENTNAFPIKPNARTSEEPLSLLWPKYTSVAEAFICPGTKEKP